MNSLMNNTKWGEIRVEMLNFPFNIFWRTKDLNGFISQWDSDWYYHFKEDGYKTIEWLELKTRSDIQMEVLKVLKQIHVPGEIHKESIIIFGYKQGYIEYL